MAVLLLAEHDNKSLAPATAKALTAARAFGGDVDILIAGENCRPVAEAAAKLEGVRKVLLAEAPHLSQRLAEETAGTIIPFCSRPRRRRARTYCRASPLCSMSPRSPTLSRSRRRMSSSGRSMPATRSKPSRRPTRSWLPRCVPRPSQAQARLRLRVLRTPLPSPPRRQKRPRARRRARGSRVALSCLPPLTGFLHAGPCVAGGVSIGSFDRPR